MKSLFVAVLAVATVASGSVSASTTTRIVVADLNLATSDGARTFDQRVDAAAQRLCRNLVVTGTRLPRRESCKRAVREEALAQLSARARTDYAAAQVTIQG